MATVERSPMDDETWWDSLTDDEQDAVLSSAWTGNSEDFSWLDDEDGDD